MDAKVLDETINEICKWIQEELNGNGVQEYGTLPEMTKALAELVSARAKYGV